MAIVAPVDVDFDDLPGCCSGSFPRAELRRLDMPAPVGMMQQLEPFPSGEQDLVFRTISSSTATSSQDDEGRLCVGSTVEAAGTGFNSFTVPSRGNRRRIKQRERRRQHRKPASSEEHDEDEIPTPCQYPSTGSEEDFEDKMSNIGDDHVCSLAQALAGRVPVEPEVHTILACRGAQVQSHRC
mmetsp:Transcript_28340/g.65681  ORF Transcript_28340/g.65681 Transcript_28340/m.65681 type:complete len:183 (+) Transcript_28340:95-643(+)|eukprot:CAMPEP_0178436314 /NCGR_PEP_ID=MMETSP0689_2-20121128/34376_1 /TAXON_ID=160604 /ORGANISM="Amphidinium massartii, Strain CS-259" /LENGTH=182 /DNA_ID=CAMNT_0020058407 /DNA_START=8 /DNA_END=556 /DNA_ORIENTATION=-